LCVAESTGEASVATYSRDAASKRNALGDWEFCVDTDPMNGVQGTVEVNYRAKDVEEVFEEGERMDELVQDFGKGLVQGMIVHGGEMEVVGHLLALALHQVVLDAFLYLPEILCNRLQNKSMGTARNTPILSSSCNFSALCTNTSTSSCGLSWDAAIINSTSLLMGCLYRSCTGC
jgi:hypothetical protein